MLCVLGGSHFHINRNLPFFIDNESALYHNFNRKKINNILIFQIIIKWRICAESHAVIRIVVCWK